jgi:hypothetical protein
MVVREKEKRVTVAVETETEYGNILPTANTQTALNQKSIL